MSSRCCYLRGPFLRAFAGRGCYVLKLFLRHFGMSKTHFSYTAGFIDNCPSFFTGVFLTRVRKSPSGAAHALAQIALRAKMSSAWSNLRCAVPSHAKENWRSLSGARTQVVTSPGCGKDRALCALRPKATWGLLRPTPTFSSSKAVNSLISGELMSFASLEYAWTAA